MTRAHAQRINNRAILWQGNVNGVHVECISQNPNEVLYLRGIATVHTIGAELVDEQGERRAFSVRRWGP